MWESGIIEFGFEFELRLRVWILDSLSVFHPLLQLIICSFIKVKLFISKSPARSQALQGLISFICYIKSNITHSSHDARLLHIFAASAVEEPISYPEPAFLLVIAKDQKECRLWVRDCRATSFS